MTDSSSNTYSLNKLAALPADFVPATGSRLCRIIFKQTAAEKEAGAAKKDSVFCQLPTLSTNFVQAFILNEQGADLVGSYLQGLQDAVVRKVWVENKRSPCDADLGIDALIAAGQATQSEGFRLSGKLIEDCFKNGWQNQIAYGLAITRDATALVLFDRDDVAEGEIDAYWSSETGAKFVGIAKNYLRLFVRGADRKPTFETDAIKAKVLDALEFCEDSPVLSRVKANLQAAPVASVDDTGL